jgi:hypothetical protein
VLGDHAALEPDLDLLQVGVDRAFGLVDGLTGDGKVA